MGLLNSILARLGNPSAICDEIEIENFVSLHFLIVHFTNVLHAFTCLLLWWCYDHVTTWSILKHLQKILKLL